MTRKNSGLLQALKINAVFSTVSAILMLISAGWLANQLGLPGPVPVFIVAAVLLLFAAQLWNIVRTGVTRTGEVAGIIGGDIAWVIATGVLVGLYFDLLTTTGLVLVDSVALIVLVFAILQIRSLRRSVSD